MPNKHSILKKLFSVQLPQDLYRKLEVKAKQFGVPVNTYVVMVLTKDLANVILTEQDEKIIAQRINEAIAKRSK